MPGFHRSATIGTCAVHLSDTRHPYGRGLMDTLPRLDGERTPPERSGAVEVFLQTLQGAQAQYIASLQNAVFALRNQTGQMPCLAAAHGRLTQRMFDAQRLILSQRADADATVSRIARDTELEAIAMVNAARRAVATNGRTTVARRAVVRPAPSAARPIDEAMMSPRQEIAAMGMSVVHSLADVEALARVIDEAFEPDEPDGVAALRQLGALLDDWWSAETQESRAAIDDARARSALRLHIAQIHADEISGGAPLLEEVEAVEPEPIPAGAPTPALTPTVEPPAITTRVEQRPVATVPDLLPTTMLRAFEGADATNLSDLLASLSASLDDPRDDTPSSGPVIADRRDDEAVEAHVVDVTESGITAPVEPRGLVIRLDAPVPAPALGGSDEAFRRFWVRGGQSEPETHSLGWIALRVALPMAGIMGAVAAVMAVIG
ncbi:MAG: hypothetical protein JWM34_1101 [Ilumatobacteraceae bacterium]|nr:hypothetical protein [Ilumatobacteraceae bacterium]